MSTSSDTSRKTRFCGFPHRRANFCRRSCGDGCKRLQTVADTKSRITQTRVNPQTPNVKREPFATHSGKTWWACPLPREFAEQNQSKPYESNNALCVSPTFAVSMVSIHDHTRYLLFILVLRRSKLMQSHMAVEPQTWQELCRCLKRSSMFGAIAHEIRHKYVSTKDPQCLPQCLPKVYPFVCCINLPGVSKPAALRRTSHTIIQPDSTKDAIIIGAGVIGNSIATELSRSGWCGIQVDIAHLWTPSWGMNHCPFKPAINHGCEWDNGCYLGFNYGLKYLHPAKSEIWRRP